MRRCPECDFIYEDDEGLCAMDGAALVNLSGPLPFEETDLSPTLSPAHSYGRSLTLIAAGIMLVLAVFLWYHEGAKRRAVQSNLQSAKSYYLSPSHDQEPGAKPVATETPFMAPSPQIAAPVSKTDATRRIYRAQQSEDNEPFRPAPVGTPVPLPRPSPSFTLTRPKPEPPSATSVPLTAKPTITTAAPRTVATPEKKTSTPPANQKNESKITSFLKKTGRVLKKPFNR